MRELSGVAASPGASIAPAWVYSAADLDLPDGKIEDSEAEVGALKESLEAVAAGLEAKAESAEGELAEILEAQAAMARDPELAALAEKSIRNDRTPASRAVVEAGETFAEALDASDSEYLAARATDVRDVCARIARRLTGADEASLGAISEPSIIVARDLPPADVAELDVELVRGIVTQEGGRTSHTAIVARALRIPAVVGIDGLLDPLPQSDPIAVDGDSGEVYLDPDSITRTRIENRIEEARNRRSDLESRAKKGPAATKDGHRIELAANIGTVIELDASLEEGAEAVGLLRTELLFLDRSEAPGLSDHIQALESMAARLGERRLVVRTFDFGADKPVGFLDAADEANPALGVRGIRLAAKHPQLLDDQLSAVAAVAKQGASLAVMAPMVATVQEAEWFIERARRAGVADAGVEIGVMIEVPSAVLMAGELARRLDFLSIGTNDLAQYLHAADRMQGSLSHLQDPFSPALLRAVKRICDDSRDRAWVGVCGEAAGDPAWALVAVGLGVRELSMGAQSLLEVKVALGERELADCRRAASEAMDAPGPEEARAIAGDLVR